MLQSDEKVLVEGLRLDIACLTRAYLLHEALALHARIVQLREGVGDLDPTGEGFEPRDLVRIVGVALGQG